MPETKKIEEIKPEALERRIMPIDDVEMRVSDGDNPKISGYAAKYGLFTDLGFFREKIKSGAFDDALKDKSLDVRCLKNHDPNLILGRTKSGTLRLDTNTVGLRFDNDIPNTTTGKDTLEEIRRGDISGASFAFTVAEDDWRYYEDKPAERTIIKIGQLYDVSPCTYPAYPDTTVAARSLERVLNENETPVVTDTEVRTEPEVPAKTEDEIKEAEKIKRQQQIDIRRKRMEADCIHKRATDQINKLKNIKP